MTNSFRVWMQRFYTRWGGLILLIQGTIVVAISIVLLFVAISVTHQHNKEREQIRTACERSRVLGPPLIKHLQGAEERLKLGALEEEVTFNGKKTSVLQFYKDTIPKHCA